MLQCISLHEIPCQGLDVYEIALLVTVLSRGYITLGDQE